MIPRDQMSTFGPYAFRVTTSGAIQYGVPTIVLRLFCSGVIWAQKPKSAAEEGRGKSFSCLLYSGWLFFSKNFYFLVPVFKRDLLSFTDPSIPKRMLSLFMSLWITWLECRKSKAWRHYEDKSRGTYIQHPCS